MKNSYDFAIIGCGPAGYEAAVKLTVGGKKVIVFEPAFVGGTCLNCGCIPTKAYLYKAKQRDLFTKFKVTPQTTFGLEEIKSTTSRTIKRLRLGMENTLKGHNVPVISEPITLISADYVQTNLEKYTFQQLIIASGTKPYIPEMFSKFANDPNLLTNENIFNLAEFPQSLIIIGAGAIGIEFAFFFSAFGIPITIIESMPTMMPGMDIDQIKEIKRLLKIRKVKLLEDTQLFSTNKLDADFLLNTNNGDIRGSHVLLAAGRKPIIPNNSLKLELTKNGFIATNENFQTSNQKVFAIGDINGKHLLAHAASFQASLLSDHLIQNKPINYTHRIIPKVIYSYPSISSIGINEKDIPADGSYKVTKTSFSILGKAQVEEASEGWIKLVISGKQLKGALIFGNNSEDLLPLLTFAIENAVDINKLHDIVYAHPSYGEVIREALSK